MFKIKFLFQREEQGYQRITVQQTITQPKLNRLVYNKILTNGTSVPNNSQVKWARDLQSQPKVSGHPQKKALPRFPSFNVATMMSTFLSIFF